MLVFCNILFEAPSMHASYSFIDELICYINNDVFLLFSEKKLNVYTVPAKFS